MVFGKINNASPYLFHFNISFGKMYYVFYQIYYTRRQAMVLHSIPIAVFILVPFFLRLSHLGFWCSIAMFGDFIIGNDLY